ncbi:hypothetical protein [Companilactobacillus crustorum]|uniref:hypothetical protein n=1 Tax=Companilactobacillus crustorum TaxID=392416 RepID=UPI0009579F00|nr:hypothetical protein [Companilactobacillus crustorum]APU71423.1 hypothetical protein BI355_1104 [Companilactobacillus crustorum]WDT66549.1 hypothetical protein NV391_04920 [Companilactobacillus crustorum]
MFKKNNNVVDVDATSSFIDSLTYWQAINLWATLLVAKNKSKSLKQARNEAEVKYSDIDKLKYELNEALNSPIYSQS